MTDQSFFDDQNMLDFCQTRALIGSSREQFHDQKQSLSFEIREKSEKGLRIPLSLTCYAFQQGTKMCHRTLENALFRSIFGGLFRYRH